MLDELPYRGRWEDSNNVDGLTCVTASFYGTPKKRLDNSSGSWTNLEDCKLLDHVSRLGENRWNLIGKKIGKSAFQCSERYLKHLRPQMLGSSKTYTTLIQHSVSPQTISLEQNSAWTKEEDSTLLQLYLTYGSNWELIANRLTINGSLYKKRTAVDVRQRYEKVVLQYWPNYNQENRPLSSLLFRNSLLSWSNTSKHNGSNNISINPNNQFTGSKTIRPTYLIPLPSLKSNSSDSTTTTTTTNGNWKIRLTQPIHHHDSGFSESGLLNSAQLSRSSSQQSLRYSVVTTSISSHNPLLSTSTPVDLIKNGPSSPINQPEFSLLPSSIIKPDSPKLLESSINDPINSPSSFSPNFNHNDCSSKITTSPLLKSTHQATNGLLNVLVADDNNTHFIIQTPTKALSEADQLSFHLTSPPAVLGSAGRYAATSSLNHKMDLDKTPIGSRLPRSPLRRPLRTRLFDNIPNNTSLPSTSLPSSFTVNNSNNNPLAKTFSTLSSCPTTKSLSYNSCDEAKCIAILTAKATAWNRALLPTTSASTTSATSCQRSHLSYFTMNNNRFKGESGLFNFNAHQPHFSDYKDSIMQFYNNIYYQFQVTNNNVIPLNPTPLKPLKFPSRKQPHLMLRRIIQVGNEDDWQEVAYGDSYASQKLLRFAKSFTNNYQQSVGLPSDFHDLSPHSSALSSPTTASTSTQSMNPNSNSDCFMKLEPTDYDY